MSADRFELATCEKRWADLRPAWDRLAEAEAHPLLWSHSALEAWRGSFAPAAAPAVACLWRGDRLAAALAGTLSGRGELRVLTDEHGPPLSELGVDAAARAALRRVATGRESDLRRIRFSHRPRREPGEVSAWCGSPGPSPVVVPLDPATIVELPDGWDAYSRQVLSRKRRKTLRNSTNRVERAGGVLEPLVGPDQFEAGTVEACLEVEHRGWKGRAGTSILSTAESASYHRRLFALLADRGALRVSTLRIDDAIAAFELGLVEKDTYHALKVSFDADYAKLSPGIVLAAAVLERVAEDGIVRADFGAGGSASDAKRMFATSHEPVEQVTVYGPQPPERLARATAVGALRVRRRAAASTLLRRLTGRS